MKKFTIAMLIVASLFYSVNTAYCSDEQWQEYSASTPECEILAKALPPYTINNIKDTGIYFEKIENNNVEYNSLTTYVKKTYINEPNMIANEIDKNIERMFDEQTHVKHYSDKDYDYITWAGEEGIYVPKSIIDSTRNTYKIDHSGFYKTYTIERQSKTYFADISITYRYNGDKVSGSIEQYTDNKTCIYKILPDNTINSTCIDNNGYHFFTNKQDGLFIIFNTVLVEGSGLDSYLLTQNGSLKLVSSIECGL